MKHGRFITSSRKRDCWDNAAMKNFLAILKKELIHKRRLRISDEARKEIFEYIAALQQV